MLRNNTSKLNGTGIIGMDICADFIRYDRVVYVPLQHKSNSTIADQTTSWSCGG